ncbi:hypothetical protein AB2537_26605 [Bacillus wiedmannii]|uniref:hypothetical protein n=1 Tax=Bacillus wiedmannii TaxID=1890302 RepID=UPI00346391D1
MLSVEKDICEQVLFKIIPNQLKPEVKLNLFDIDNVVAVKRMNGSMAVSLFFF